MNAQTTKLFLLTLVVFASSVSAQQLKPTEIIYSRTVTNMNAPPTGTNQPTIWAVGQDGSNDRFITNGTMPRISDDGRFLVFKSYTRAPSFFDPYGGYADFVVRDLATGQETVVMSLGFNNNNSGFALSPASNQGNNEIVLDRDCFMFKMNRDGTGPFQFPWENGFYCYDDFPVVRRGGDQLIAFTNNVATTPEIGGVYTMDITGANRQKIPNTTCRDFHAAWSNDNQHIAFGTVFTACSNNFPSLFYYPYFISNLVVIKPDGSGRQQITNFPTTPDCSQSNANCLTFGYVWSPNNSKVIAAGRINGVKGLFAFDSNASGSFSQIPISAGNAPDYVGGIVQPRVERNVVSAGGGVSEGGSYQLVSTIGEAVAGLTSTGGQYTFESGFWALPVPRIRAQFDFDGDGKTDPSVYRPSMGDWYLLNTTEGFRALHFGLPSDIMVPADYTGDGKTDMAVWRPSDSIWYILRSEDNTFYGAGFGANGDIPAPGDHDGDGKADLVVIRPGATQSYWFLQQSTAGFAVVPFGLAGDVPTLGDYDGDGKNDVAVYRPSAGAWFRFNSSNGSFLGVGFGISSDKVVPADYTGDGKTDLAVFRPSNNTWYILRSEDNSLTGGAFGAAGDLPSPGDYDGDGKADLGVYRLGATPGAQSVFYVLQTTAGFNTIPWGLAEDRPVPNAYVY